MDDRELRDRVTKAVKAALEARNGGLATDEFLPPKMDRRPSSEIALSSRAASWAGLPPGAPVARNTWRPTGSREDYLSSSPARLGVGRSGTRPRTQTLLKFLADHATARDAVASNLSSDIMQSHGLIPLDSAAPDRPTFLKLPDLGRRLSPDSADRVKRSATAGAQVVIVAVDGLSATAINVNIPKVLPGVLDGLQKAGIRVGQSYAVRLGRVVSADEVARIAQAEVLLLFVGERPGLKTAESMGTYVTYMKVRSFNEAMRNVISNIHDGGLRPEDAVRQIVATCQRALADKRTGIEVGR